MQIDIELASDPLKADSQVRTILYLLASLAWVDGDFDTFEQQFVQTMVVQLAEARAAAAGGRVDELEGRYLADFQHLDAYIRDLLTESTSETDDIESFVVNRLKLRALELFQEFDLVNRKKLLQVGVALADADGTVHPQEQAFLDDLEQLLQPSMAPMDVEIPVSTWTIGEASLRATVDDHHLLRRVETPFTDANLAALARSDLMLINRARRLLARQRERGKNKLFGRQTLAELRSEAPFLDQHVYVEPTVRDRDYELLVFGDLHGCYSCLKAGLLQSNILAKLEAYQRDPTSVPEPRVIFLGDYIDRGRYGLEGVMRTALTLFCAFPDQVYLIRGNHEWFLEREGQMRSGVLPAEAIDRWLGVLGNEHFRAYKDLFESMGACLAFDKTLFVHGGIPRDDVTDDLWEDLSTLNHPLVRFQMMWSDPSPVDEVPVLLQKRNARFSFGKNQLRRFLSRMGAHSVIRGHEKVEDGFEVVIDDGEARLMSVFSAGGMENRELPARSSYRKVTPMALLVHFRNGEYEVAPFELKYADYIDGASNGFFGEISTS